MIKNINKQIKKLNKLMKAFCVHLSNSRNFIFKYIFSYMRNDYTHFLTHVKFKIYGTLLSLVCFMEEFYYTNTNSNRHA